MSCEHPILALDLGVDAETGKHRIKIIPKRLDYNVEYLEYKYGRENLLALPCGQCFSCRENYRKMWAHRCVCESKKYLSSSFLTLTYDDSHVPSHLEKKHFQKFIKQLRNDGLKIRYFGCGEYGSQHFRPHGHIVLFGYFPDDAVPYAKTDAGIQLYTSKYLTKVWSKGLVIVEEFHPNNAAYVAGYVGKKLTKDTPFEDYPEFIFMSRRPGIGSEYIKDHADEFKNYGFLLGDNGLKLNVRRYALRILDISDESKAVNLEQLRLNENELMNICSLRHREQLWSLKGENVKKKVNSRRRSL